MGSKVNVISMVIASDFCRVNSNFYIIYYLRSQGRNFGIGAAACTRRKDDVVIVG